MVAVLASSAAPPTSTIAGANDLVASGSTVLAATTTGIAHSTDGGVAWRRVLAGYDFWSVADAGDGFVALGATAVPAGAGPGSPVVATSADGVRWQVAATSIPAAGVPDGFAMSARLAASGMGPTGVEVAVPDVVASFFNDGGLRSADGGATWAPLALDEPTAIARVPGAATMYATVADGSRWCVYRSDDTGAHWSVLADSCQAQGLDAVDFVDALHGFAGGGTSAKFGGAQIVEATSDGGATWHVMWASAYDANSGQGDGDDGIVRLAFADLDHGYAVTGGCSGGENGPCPGVVYTTHDGGRQWTRTNVQAAAVVTLDDVDALAANDGVLARTTDGGSQWSLRAPAADVATQALAGGPGLLLWRTDIATFVSADAGRNWSTATAATLARLPTGEALEQSAAGQRLAEQGAVSFALGSGNEAVAITDDGAAQCPGADPASTAAQASKLALLKPGWTPQPALSVLYRSSDSGGSWRRVSTVPFTPNGNTLAVDGATIVVGDSCGGVEISADGGTRWAHETLFAPMSGCMPAVAGREIWLACTGGNPGRSYLARSDDAGGAWSVIDLGRYRPGWDTVTPIGQDAALVAVSGSLWRTTDGGRDWSQSWPQLAGEQ